MGPALGETKIKQITNDTKAQPSPCPQGTKEGL